MRQKAQHIEHSLKLYELLLDGFEALTNPKQTQKLRTAMQEYENDRWRIISTKVGNGFSATACKEKATEFENEEPTQDGASLPPIPEDEPETS